MTFLEIMQAVAKNAGIEVPTSITTTDPDHVLLSQFINEAGSEVARRVDWGALRKTQTLTGDGTAKDFDLASDFDRFGLGSNVIAGASPVRGSLEPNEWLFLTPVAGTPRYFYLRGALISLYPYLKTDDTALLQYQSKNWAGSAEKLVAQTDSPLIPGKLLISGAVWRWRRHVGKAFDDYLAEFEAQLADLARNDGGVRLP